MHLWLLYHAGARRGSRRRGAGNPFLLAASSPPPSPVPGTIFSSLPGTFVPRRVAFLLRPRSLFPLDSLARQFISRGTPARGLGGGSVDSGFREEKVGLSLSGGRVESTSGFSF